jgi:hypothetical protein
MIPEAILRPKMERAAGLAAARRIARGLSYHCGINYVKSERLGVGWWRSEQGKRRVSGVRR